MDARHTDILGPLVLVPQVFEDDRGFFFESWNAATFREVVGLDVEFVQDNHSRSAQGVIRGLHYQQPDAQGKLVRCVMGTVWDVAVDIRRSSPTFGDWIAEELSAENQHQLWVPEGFAHGLLAVSPVAEVLYKATGYYNAVSERSIRWDDPEIAIEWPLDGTPLLSDKDAAAPLLADAVVFD